MSFEIELKARLNDCAPVEQLLSTVGTYCRSYIKSDSYWFPSSETDSRVDSLPSGVRVRRENITDTHGTARESILVTYKQKEISGGIEVNDEREFTVSDADLFEELLRRLGLCKVICKEKQGRAWTISGQQPVLAELSLVTGLGWFLELEIIADNNDPPIVEACRKQLLDLLEKLKIPAEQIEPRPYMTLLREIG